MTEGPLIAEALKALGYTIIPSAKDSIVAKNSRGKIYFYRERNVWMAAGDTQFLPAIVRQYAELGVRRWANRRGLSVLNRVVTAGDAVQITLVNRRG